MKPLPNQATAANGWHGEWQEPTRRGWAVTDEGMERFLKELERIESGEHEPENSGNLIDVWQAVN